MAHITIGQMRKDRKFPVRVAFEGAPNMFGGRDFPKVFNKLYTHERLQNAIGADDTVVNNSQFTLKQLDIVTQ